MAHGWRALEQSLKPPYDFHLSFKATPPPPPFILERGVLRRCFEVNGDLIPVKIEPVGDVEEPGVMIYLPPDIDSKAEEIALSKVVDFLCGDVELNSVYEVMEDSPILRRMAKVLRGLKPWSTPTVWEGLVDSIIFQQVSLRAAFAMMKELTERLGERVLMEGELFYGFPQPLKVASLNLAEIKACKLSWNKARYVKEAASKVMEGSFNLEGLKEEPTETALRRLGALKGVGRWTAELVALIALRRWEVIPADDLGVRRAFAKLFLNSTDTTAEEVRRIAKPWGRWRGLIGYYVLVSYEMGIRL